MKEHKPLSSKKPPAPEENHGLIKDWIANVRPTLNPIVSDLDKLIRAQLVDPRYSIKWGKAYYGSSKWGWCIELVAYDVSVNIVFLNGQLLENPPALGGQTRYIKIKGIEELQSSKIHAWIKQSCNMSGWAW